MDEFLVLLECGYIAAKIDIFEPVMSPFIKAFIKPEGEDYNNIHQDFICYVINNFQKNQFIECFLRKCEDNKTKMIYQSRINWQERDFCEPYNDQPLDGGEKAFRRRLAVKTVAFEPELDTIGKATSLAVQEKLTPC